MTNRVKKELLLLSVFLVIVLALLSVWYGMKPDYLGIVRELEENKFTLYPEKINPEEEPFIPDIYFSKDTKISGETTSMLDLKEDQVVKVWIDEIEGEYMAKKIIITKE